MNKVRLTLTLCLATFALAGIGVELPALQSPAQIIESVKQERHSEGFEVRLKISSIGADGQRSTPVKLAIIGQFTAERERLFVRGISPDTVRGRWVAAEKGADGRIRSIEYTDKGSGAAVEGDPSSRLFDTGLVLWDMFAPWWSWPTQRLGRSERIGGKECTIVQSQSDAGSSPIQTVSTCINRDAKLSLRTQMFDSEGAQVRTISAERLLRKKSGAMAAKMLRIVAADHGTTEVEVYGGDENYAITPDTFAALRIPSEVRSQGR